MALRQGVEADSFKPDTVAVPAVPDFGPSRRGSCGSFDIDLEVGEPVSCSRGDLEIWQHWKHWQHDLHDLHDLGIDASQYLAMDWIPMVEQIEKQENVQWMVMTSHTHGQVVISLAPRKINIATAETQHSGTSAHFLSDTTSSGCGHDFRSMQIFIQYLQVNTIP